MERATFPMCCGIAVMCDFNASPADIAFFNGRSMTAEETVDANMAIAHDDTPGARRGQLTLAALNHPQNDVWGSVLLEKGWKLMSRHRNGGHDGPEGRNIYLYGYHPGQVDPDQFENYGDPPIAEDRPEVRVVELEFYANLRDKGRRGPFSGIEQAQEQYPLCRRFNRREIMSDGSSFWIEDI